MGLKGRNPRRRKPKGLRIGTGTAGERPFETRERVGKLGDVEYLEYTHATDGEEYYHEFRPGAQLWALKDGSLLIEHPTRKLWKDYK